MTDATLTTAPETANGTEMVRVNRLTKKGTVDRRQFNPGRPTGTGTFDDKWGIVEGLRIVQNAPEGMYHPAKEGAQMSRVLTLKLAEMGYLKTVEVKGEGRGRPAKFFTLSGKGKSYLTLSRRWKE